MKFFVLSLGVDLLLRITKLIVNGVTQKLSKDEFLLLDLEVHTIEADKVVIVELICTRGTPWKWGVYLIEPGDIFKRFEIPEGFGEIKGGLPVELIASAIIAMIVIIGIFLWLRKKKAIP